MEISFPITDAQAEEPGIGLVHFAALDLYCQAIPPDSLLLYHGHETFLFLMPPFLPVPTWLLLYSLSYRNFLQLVFRGFSVIDF